MPSKLKIKMGHIEFEYEGDTQFDKDAIKDLFTHLESLVGVTPGTFLEGPASGSGDGGGALGGSLGVGQNGGDELSNLAANTVAARLGVKTGPELAIAAAATLQIAQGKDSFTRKQLLEVMQSAKTYYKTSMGSNLGAALSTLVGTKRINALNNNEMSLPAAEIASLRAKIAAG